MSLTDWQVQVGGLILGAGTPYLLSAFDRPKADTTSGDKPLAGEDGLAFGRDFLTGPVITIEGLIIAPDAQASTVLNLQDAWESAWQGDAVRRTPGAVAELVYRMPGRQARTIYGRPRQFTPSTLANVMSGSIPITCDWQAADHRTYEAEQVITLGTMPDTSGGITWPVTWPLTWAGEASAGDRVNNTGTASTWPVITFRGPIGTPRVAWGGLSLAVGTTLAAGQSITVDTRPWARTVLRESGGSVAGLLRGNRLGEMQLPPGLTEVQFSGADNTGTASCEIRWRSASTSL